ncbi:hypothetical protein [Streptomyces roseoviridis]|uniref:ABC transporter permease n=1 Tax=Streptomyces roseoviridis TaxID=67361 RepID=A0ABV5QNN7_9ACTN
MEPARTPTREDVVDAVRVQLRHGSFRALRRWGPVTAVPAAPVVALLLAAPAGPTM